MYDYIKGLIISKALVNKLLNNKLLEFHETKNLRTKKVSGKRVAELHGLKFRVYDSGTIIITGSLHKFYNSLYGGIQSNCDVFTLSKLLAVLDFFHEDLEINSNEIIIQNLEFGFNIITDIAVKEIIRCIIAYKGKPFSRMKNLNSSRIDGIEYYASEFAVKIYDKFLQYYLDGNVLRFEKKILKMRNQFNQQITLMDLAKHEVWESCLVSLHKCIDELIIIEPLNTSLSRAEEEKYEFCSNPLNWTTMSKEARRSNKKSTNTISEKYGEYQIKRMLKQLIDETFIYAYYGGDNILDNTFSPLM